MGKHYKLGTTEKQQEKYQTRMFRQKANYQKKHDDHANKSKSEFLAIPAKSFSLGNINPEIKASLINIVNIFAYMASTLDSKKFTQYINAVSKMLLSMLLLTLPANVKAQSGVIVYNLMKELGNTTEYIQFGCNSKYTNHCPDAATIGDIANNIGATVINDLFLAEFNVSCCHFYAPYY